MQVKGNRMSMFSEDNRAKKLYNILVSYAPNAEAVDKCRVFYMNLVTNASTLHMQKVVEKEIIYALYAGIHNNLWLWELS